VTNGVS